MSLKNHGFVCIKQNTILDVPANGTRQHYLFEVPAFFYQVIQVVFVRDAHHSLLDDGSVVENFRNVVGRRAENFYSTVIGLMVRLGANERGQERVVNVDDALRKIYNEL